MVMAGIRRGSSGEKVDDDNGVVASPAIRVNQARQLFGVMGDEILAQNLQDGEFQEKYSWNREVRQTARKDVPLAKATYDEEEERLQRERLEFLQNQTRINDEDAKLARQYQKEEQLGKERDRLRQDILDQELAKRIQLKEIQDQSRPEVRRTRDTETDGRGAFNGHELGGTTSSFAGFHLSSATGDDGLTEEERKHLVLLQDEELALALQEHEQLRAVRCERRQILILPKEQMSQPVLLVLPAMQQGLQSTTSSRRPDEFQSSQGSVLGAGFPRQPSNQTGHRSTGPPMHQAPPAPVHNAIQTHRPTTRSANDVSDKSVTLVTSVGKSEFFRTIPAAEATSKEPNTLPKSSRMTPGTPHDSSAEINRTQSAHTSRKMLNKEAEKKSNIKKH